MERDGEGVLREKAGIYRKRFPLITLKFPGADPLAGRQVGRQSCYPDLVDPDLVDPTHRSIYHLQRYLAAAVT